MFQKITHSLRLTSKQICVQHFSTLLGRGRAEASLSLNALRSFRGGGDSVTEEQKPIEHNRFFLAVGSNLGDRFQNIASSVEMLLDPTFHPESYQKSRMGRSSFLYQTAPMYVIDQPPFLNGAVEIETDLCPDALLKRAKEVEKELGRNFTEIRNGPRPVDLDILLWDSQTKSAEGGSRDRCVRARTLDTTDLIIPHRLMHEREFVLQPLKEATGPLYEHPLLKKSIEELLKDVQSGTEESPSDSGVRVLPLRRGRMLSFNETIIMGILNVTPDSFSDGGKWTSSLDRSIKRALEMETEGAAIIDIGGESTRPGAKEIPIEEQIRRTAPVIEGIRKSSDVAISIDTRHAAVAEAAVKAGADIVNDVSGGIFDPEMLPVVSRLGVPIILMHMRGTPESMQEMTEYEDVVEDVIDALLERSRAAAAAGIPRWLQVVDPGIGFAKDIDGNLSLLKHMGRIRKRVGNMPILLGTSRKGFIGKLTGETNAEDRDFGTVGSCVAALCLNGEASDCDILRVHNVKAARDGALVMDAIRRAK